MEIFNLESETHLSSCRKKVFSIAVIFIIILAIYSNTFHSSWHFDDIPNIIENEALHLNKINWDNIKKTFFASLGGTGKIYRPIACLSFALNYYLGGDNVFGYHLVNISIHIIASVFLFLFIYNSLNTPILKVKYGPNSYNIALLATVLWSINPIQTQAITYIVQRMASMAGMFYIMSMYFYLKGRISEKKPLIISYYLLCAVTATLALGSKQNAAMLPISIFFFDIFIIQGLTKENIKRNILIFAIFVFITLAFSLVLVAASSSFEDLFSGYSVRRFTLIERLLTEPRVILFYITLLLYPMPDRLCITHDITISHGLLDPPATIISILFILGILCLAVIKSRKWPFISFCGIFFFLNHIIESSIFPLEMIFEHRNYIPSMLFFVPLAILAIKAIEYFSCRRAMRIILLVFIVLVFIGQGHSAFIRNFIWKTDESLWMDAVDKYPKLPRSYHNLGKYYQNIDKKEKALEQYELSLKLTTSPNGIITHLTYYNMGLIFMSFNEHDKAREYFLKAVEIGPGLSNAYNNLGVMAIKEGKYDEALNYFIKALTYNKNDKEAHTNLGFVLLRKNRLEEAIGEFKKALEIKKDFLPALINLGIAYKYKGEFNRAIKHFKRALGLNNRSITTHLHLIETYFLEGQPNRSEETARNLIELISIEDLSVSLDKMIKRDTLSELPNLEILLPIIAKAYKEKADIYKSEADKLLDITGLSP